ncbi:MAG: conjugal transfer protein TraF [Candidatus Tectomicrobia bacterium]|uniref:Conjugal transfer protein TraF n=1 Tax=Tectimicrobiota bacterium TaxID=2528274 RepID=A0A933LPE8_UNCTE|nr:conjugal transfer protein TraF [Candidatus Tectomicrobia bacterium]
MPIVEKVKLFMALLLSSVFFFHLPPAMGAEPWWDRGDQGWFFYHEKIETEPESKPEIMPVYPESPPPLFSEIMKKRGEELLSQAMENPTSEKVKAYMDHNQQMMALSRNFSLIWQRVLMSNPELLSGLLTSDADKDIYYRQSAESKKEALRKLAAQAGLFFFYDTTCPYCVRQAKHLKTFLDEYPFFIVKSVTMNGESLPEFPEAALDNGIAARLGVTSHPAIFLAYPPDRFERVATGLVTPGELRDKLLLYTGQSSEDSPHLDTKETSFLDALNSGGNPWSDR